MSNIDTQPTVLYEQIIKLAVNTRPVEEQFLTVWVSKVRLYTAISHGTMLLNVDMVRVRVHISTASWHNGW